MDEVNLGGAKGAAAPRSKATGVNNPHSEDKLTSQKTERCRSLAGRLQKHSLDDTGLVMRGMNTPRVLDEARLHRVVRRIAGAHADHAADDESRRSVSCSQEFLGGHLFHT